MIQVKVGREIDCDVQADHETVSQYHCQFTYQNGSWLLEDLGSTNGTYVNGQEITRGLVNPTDQIELGEYLLNWALIEAFSRSQDNQVYKKNIHSEQTQIVYLEELGVEALQVNVSTDDITLGSAADCYVENDLTQRTHIHITSSDTTDPEKLIAMRHARVFFNCGKILIEDLRTKSGTKLYNEDKKLFESINTCELNQSDIIKIGDKYLRFTSSIDFPLPSDGQRIDVKNVSLEVIHNESKKPFKIVNGVSFSAMSGEIIAIMGPSGSGKTTLLNCIAGISVPTDGKVLLNGQSIYKQNELDAKFGRLIGHAPQFDAFHSSLTVFECLEYTARLRAPADLSRTEIKERVLQVIKDVDLEGYENILLGSSDLKSLSGGQRKRVNIAMELVAGCEVLLLDEPTSGLSSSDTSDIIRLLNLLAKRDGKTIILTIHQPAYETFIQMDYLLLLEEGGHTAYFGPTAIDSFNFFNIDELNADRILEKLPEKKDFEVKIRKGVFAQQFMNSAEYSAVQRRLQSLPDDMALDFPKVPSVLLQFWILTSRLYKLKSRDLGFFSLLLLFPALVTSAFTLVMGSELSDQMLDHYRVEHGMLVILTIMICFFGSLGSVLEIVSEKTVWRREKRANTSTFAYLMSKVLVYTLVSVIFPLLSLAVCVGISQLSDYSILSSHLWTYSNPLISTFLAATAAGLLMSSLVARTKAASYTLAINAAVFYSIIQIVFAVFAPLHVTYNETPKATVLKYASATTTARWSMSSLLSSNDICESLEEKPTPNVKPNYEKLFHFETCKRNYLNSGISPASTKRERVSTYSLYLSYLGNALLTFIAWFLSFFMIKRIK